MNWAQFKDPLFYLCLAGAVVASWSLTQDVADSNNLYRPQRSWGKVMFLHVSLILFTGGWGVGGWIPSMHCRVVSQHALQFSRFHTQGKVVLAAGLACLQAHTQEGKLRGILLGASPGPHQEGVSTGGFFLGGSPGPHCTEADPPTATAAGGTHPTGMHSCLKYFLSLSENI